MDEKVQLGDNGHALITSPAYFHTDFDQILINEGLSVQRQRFHDRQSLLDSLADVTVLCHRVETRVDRELLEAAPKLKIVASATAGLDHIDLEALEERQIVLINDRSKSNTYPTAEFTIALILDAFRNVTSSYLQIREHGNWEREPFIGTELQGSVLGIVGCGSIGSTVATLANAFGMDVVIFDPFIEHGEIQRLHARECEVLSEIFKEADVISIHCPLLDSTRGLIGREELSYLRPGTFLINNARAAVIQEDALIELIEDEERKIVVATDVYEPHQENDQITELSRSTNRVLLTPHLGASTEQAIKRCCRFLSKKIIEALKE